MCDVIYVCQRYISKNSSFIPENHHEFAMVTKPIVPEDSFFFSCFSGQLTPGSSTTIPSSMAALGIWPTKVRLQQNTQKPHTTRRPSVGSSGCLNRKRQYLPTRNKNSSIAGRPAAAFFSYRKGSKCKYTEQLDGYKKSVFLFRCYMNGPEKSKFLIVEIEKQTSQRG